MLLNGIRILELTAFHSGTVGAALLGQFGAEVIKLEDPERGDPGRGFATMSGATSQLADGRTVMFETANSDKMSVAIDLKTEDGRKIAYKLLEQSDVFLSNYRDKVLKKLGLDWETVHSLNSQLIYVTASGEGAEGPNANTRGFDWVGQALSGMMWAAGDRRAQEPTILVGGPIDQGGGIYAALAISMGLASRAMTGKGSRADVSLLGTALGLMTLRINQYALAGRSVQRHGRDTSRQPLSNWYRCGDEKWLLLCELQTDRFWEDFCKTIGRDDIQNDPRFDGIKKRRENYKALIEILDETFLKRSRDEWLAQFRSELPDFVVAPVLDEAEAIANPQARANGYIVDWPGTGGAHGCIVGSPMNFFENAAKMQRAAPELGQDTEEVLINKLGYDWEMIGELRDKGVFG